MADILALLSTTSDISISGPDTALAARLSTTPSQPDPKQAAPSVATAPGADTGGEEPSILPAAPLPDHLPDAGNMVEATPPQPTSIPAVQAQNVEPSSEVLDGPSPSLPGAERAVDRAPSMPPRGRPETTRAQVVACHHANPSWPSKLIAEHLGISEDAVRATASRKKLKLVSWWDYQRAEAAKKAAALAAPAPPETPPAASVKADKPVRAASLAVPRPAKRKVAYQRVEEAFAANPSGSVKEIAEAANCHASTASGWVQQMRRALADKTTEDLKAATAVGALTEPTPAPEPEPQPATSPEAVIADEAQEEPPATTATYRMAPKIAKRAPQGRFYLRDQEGRYVHQSLQPSPTGPGPLMTSDRKWGWYDTMERYRGAKGLWPQLAFMRKEAVHA